MAIYAKISCALPDDPKVIDAGDLAELLYLRCILRSREALSDGIIDRRLLSRWAAGIRGNAEKLATTLVEVGLWEVCPEGWRVPLHIWRKWNPTKSEVEAKREAEAERKRSYRKPKMSQQDGGRTPQGIHSESESAALQPEPEPEPEPEYVFCGPGGPRNKNIDPKSSTGQASRGRLLDAIAAAGGAKFSELTKRERGRAAKALDDIQAANPGVTAAEIERRVSNYALHFNVVCTPTALASNWSACAKPPPGSNGYDEAETLAILREHQTK